MMRRVSRCCHANYSLPKRSYDAQLSLIEADAETRVVRHNPVVTRQRHETAACRTGTLQRE